MRLYCVRIGLLPSPQGTSISIHIRNTQLEQCKNPTIGRNIRQLSKIIRGTCIKIPSWIHLDVTKEAVAQTQSSTNSKLHESSLTS